MNKPGVRPISNLPQFLGMIGGDQEAAGEERVQEGSVEQEDPEGLDDAVLEELMRDEDNEQAPVSRPEEGESEDLLGEQPNGPEPAEDAPGEEAPQRRELRCPIAPSQQEFDDHCRRGHVVYRDWCPVCVRSRGREDPHRRNEELHVREGVPMVCMDYKTIKRGKPPWMVLRDQGSRCISSHQARCKGPQDRWLVERVVRDIENLGHGAVTLKGDNEPAMQQFLAAVKNRRAQRTLLVEAREMREKLEAQEHAESTRLAEEDEQKGEFPDLIGDALGPIHPTPAERRTMDFQDEIRLKNQQ